MHGSSFSPSAGWRGWLAAALIAAAATLVVVLPWLLRERHDRIAVQQLPRPLAWSLPAGWQPAPPKPMRLAVFAVAEVGECGVFLFPGGGDALANVNRWRGQAGLPPIDQAGLERELQSDTCAFGPFAWLTVQGPDGAFLAALLTTPAGQCFVRLNAPPAQLDALRDGFLAFCRSLRP